MPKSKLIEEPGPILDPVDPGGPPELIKIAHKIEYELENYDGQESGPLDEVLDALSEFGGEALVFRLESPNEQAGGQAFENLKIKYVAPEDGLSEDEIGSLQSLAEDLDGLLLPAVQAAREVPGEAGLKLFLKIDGIDGEALPEPAVQDPSPLDDLG